MKVNFDDEGRIEEIHPAARNECNTERLKATHVREMTLAEVLIAVVQAVERRGLPPGASRDVYVRRLVCGHCGG